jgi:hypothetical protein
MLWVPSHLLPLTGAYKFCHYVLGPLLSEHTATKAAQKELTHTAYVTRSMSTLAQAVPVTSL